MNRQTYGSLHIQFLTAAISLAITVASGHAQSDGREFPYNVSYELGTSEFAPGDSITITSFRGTREVVATNETYSLEGNYTLASKEKATLAFYATVPNSGPTPTDPRQQIEITKGSGKFHLVKPVSELGYLHVSFYDGSNFGGVYFGQGDWVLQNSFSHPNNLKRQALFDYLGNPVPPPSDLDAAYTTTGLSNTVVRAAQNAGIKLGRIEIDDSEFPPLVGVVTAKGDFGKLEDQIKQLTGEFSGSVGNSKCHAFNMVPSRAFPSTVAERISRRLEVREEMLYDQLRAEGR